MVIKSYTPDDRQRVLEMFGEFYSSSAVLHPIGEQCFCATLNEADKGGSPFLAIDILEQDGQTAGYALCSFGFSSEAGGKTVWLEEFYVREKYRGKGIGRSYLEYFMQRYSSFARMRLETEPSNAAAVRLYEKFGFKKLDYCQYVLDNPTAR